MLDYEQTYKPGAKAAIDSRRLRPNMVVVGGALDIVTIECLLAPGCGAGACDNVAKKACSIGDGPEPSPPLSESLRT